MMTAVWIAVLLGAAWGAHWGSGQLAGPLGTLRRRLGLSGAAGGTLIGIASGSPETQVNIVSAVRGSAEIGLGAMLGSNIIAMPAVLTVAYLATRRPPDGASTDQAAPRSYIPVSRDAATVQALPYLAILALIAALTLPPPWRGLQPIDGLLVLAAYAAYFAQAVLRKRCKPERGVRVRRREVLLGGAGVLALAAGGFLAVLATEHLAEAFGIEPVVAGLFIAGSAAAAPEMLTTWKISRAGQVTSAVTTIIGDNAVTMTIALFPLALVSVGLGDLRLYAVNLAMVVLLPALYAAFVLAGGAAPGFRLWQVLAIDALFVAYLAVVFLWVLNVP